MRRITLKRMRLVNFKGLRDCTVDFDRRVTTIRGRNGSGKTTLFDGFTWLLFGKNSDDRQDFGVKTRAADGTIIKRLPHEVSAVLDVDGREVTLLRRLSEKWVRRRGSAEEVFDGNTEERIYDDVPCSVVEWQEKIAAICPEDVFKYITNPRHFAAQKADVQRAMLFRMAGEVPAAEIVGDNEDFAALLDQLTGKSLDELRREIRAKKTRLKASIETLSPRIDERQRDLSRSEDWEALEKAVEEKRKELFEVNGEIADRAAAYAKANRQRMAKAKSRVELQGRLLARKAELEMIAQQGYHDAMRDKREAVAKLQDLRHRLDLTQRRLAGSVRDLEEARAYRVKLLAEFKGIKAGRLTFSEGDFSCPTCHRPLDMEDIERKQTEMLARFNEDKARRLAANVEQGKANNDRMKELEAGAADCEAEAARLKEDMESQQKTIDAMPDPVCPDITGLADADSQCIEMQRSIDAIDAELAAAMERPADGERLKERQEILNRELTALAARLAKREDAERNEARIKELMQQLRTESEEFARLEGMEFTMAAFNKARVEAVDRRINGMFQTVRFKMYEQQVNGGKKETCVATVNGVPYPDLNDAGKTNAGLDIINAICRHYDIAAPIFVDNSESVNHILPTASQQVRLQVTLDPQLMVVAGGDDNDDNH